MCAKSCVDVFLMKADESGDTAPLKDRDKSRGTTLPRLRTRRTRRREELILGVSHGK